MTQTVEEVFIDVGRDFSRTPGGRHIAESKWSGEEFRTRLVEPALRQGKTVAISLDSAIGLSTSFLEEVFGGLIRTFGAGVGDRVRIIAEARPRRKRQALEYMQRAIADAD